MMNDLERCPSMLLWLLVDYKLLQENEWINSYFSLSAADTGLYWIICLSSKTLGHFRIGILTGCLTAPPTERPWPKFAPNLEPGVLNSLGGKVVRSLHLIPCGMMDSWSYFFSHLSDGPPMHGFKMVIPVTPGNKYLLRLNILVSDPVQFASTSLKSVYLSCSKHSYFYSSLNF